MNTKDLMPNPMDRADLPPEVQGFEAESFRAWRHHPMSKAVFRYLADHREALIREHRDWWLNNTEPAGAKDLEARIRAQIEQEIIELTPNAIVRFYTGQNLPGEGIDLTPEPVTDEITGY